MDWFRSHHGAPTDPKWRPVAKRAGIRFGDVAAIVWALLDYASANATERGSIEGFDTETLALTFDYEQQHIEAVIAALHDKHILANSRFVAWEKRQPKRDDGASERAKAWRERNRTQPNATERPEKNREESEQKERPAARKRADEIPPGFDDFWQAYPRKTAKPAALKAYRRAAAKGATPEQILAGLETYKRTKPDYADWAHPATWLNNERWNDEPQTSAQRTIAAAAQAGLIPMQYDEPWPQRLKAWRGGMTWNWAQWGPKPGEPGCRVPSSLLEAA